MLLTDEENAIINGEQGPTKQMALTTLVKYGDVYGAEKLVSISRSHVVMPTGASFLNPYLDILNRMVKDKLKFSVPTSINPRPFDASNPGIIAKIIYNRHEQFEDLMEQLGVISNYSCTPYFGDNTPAAGEVLGFAESSAVVYTNSVIGARTNRNSSVIEICSAIIGKTPAFGLLMDENRQADYLVEVECQEINYSLLGCFVGQKVRESVPYYTGLPDDSSPGQLKDLGAASAAFGAVGLFHVENVTPDARDLGRKLLKQNCQVLKVTDHDLSIFEQSITKPDRPNLIIIGCPHLSSQQLDHWAELIDKPVKTETWLVTAPNNLAVFKNNPQYQKLIRNRVKLMTLCPLGFMELPQLRRLRVLSNSGKLVCYTNAFYGNDEYCLHAMYGKVGK
ncbi:MAG: aconitase X [Ignavibacteriales bacterium]